VISGKCKCLSANELFLYIAKGKSFPSVFGADVNVQPLFIACFAITVVSCRTGIPQECPLCSLMALYKSIYCYYIIIIFFSAAGGGFYADRGMHMHQYRPRPMWNQPMAGAGPYVAVELCCI